MVGIREMLLKKYKEIILFMLVSCIISLVMFFQEFSFLYLMLSWIISLVFTGYLKE